MERITKPVLRDDALYLGDNGRCYCGEHSGMSARYTGHDISGQRVMEITPTVLAECRAAGFTPACEQPRCKKQASALFVVA